jgi:murein DD-endopeptidase MepM/ murein hydrolase activator NlpD
MSFDTEIRYPPLKTTGIAFSPVISLPADYEVYDFTKGYDPNRLRTSDFGIGRYNEHRPGMYAGDQFIHGRRDIHVGVDIATPVGEPVHAFYQGVVLHLGDNHLPWDYGPTIITQHVWHQQTVFALHGHLSRKSLDNWQVGDRFPAGHILGYVGSKDENGGWNPHVHFQLSLIKPSTHDLPGAVSAEDLEWALNVFPDPRCVLGPVYD